MNRILLKQESMAGSATQATGTVEFEDDMWIGNQLKPQNSLQRVLNIPGVLPEGCLHNHIPPRAD